MSALYILIVYFHFMRIRLYWLYIFLAFTLVAFLGYREVQEPITYDLASQFDGNDYRDLYNYISKNNSDSLTHPFSQRILVPFLATIIGSESVLLDFQIINLVFALLSIWITFKLWRLMGFELKWFIAGFIWLIFHWTGLIRLNAFDPITVDVPLYFFQALFLWLILKRKFIHLLWLAPLATIQKESFIPLMMVLMVYATWYNRKTQEGYYNLPIIGISLIVAICSNLVVNTYFVPFESGKNSLIMLAYHAKEALLNPFEIIRWLAAMAMAFGPALFLTFDKYRRTFRNDNTRNLLVLFTLVYLGFGILAGGDMTRIIFLGFPFIATWIIFELQEIRTKHLALIGLLSLPLMMLHKTIPNPAFEWELWQVWYPEFAPNHMVLIVLGYVTLVFFILSKVQKTKLKSD